jgi:hypothetical protein
VNQELEAVRIRDNIIAIYESNYARLTKYPQFRKRVLIISEVVILVREEMTEREAKQRMQKKWAVVVNTIETAGEILLKTLQERYCPKSNRPDKNRIIALGVSLD